MQAKEKSFLKKQAHAVDELKLGKTGITDAFLTHVQKNLQKNELVKIRIAKSLLASPKEIATELEQQLECVILRVVGRVITLYKESDLLEPADRILNHHAQD